MTTETKELIEVLIRIFEFAASLLKKMLTRDKTVQT